MSSHISPVIVSIHLGLKTISMHAVEQTAKLHTLYIYIYICLAVSSTDSLHFSDGQREREQRKGDRELAIIEKDSAHLSAFTAQAAEVRLQTFVLECALNYDERSHRRTSPSPVCHHRR